jgi:ABC-type branched-subunit amino acid transport system ATPase component
VSTTAPVLETRGLVAGYVPQVDILHGIDLTLMPGEMVTIVGPNGAGKSTLIRAVIGLLTPRHGAVLLRGEEITGTKPHRVVARGIGYVAQRENVFATLTVEENLELGATALGANPRPRLPRVLELFPRLRERRRQRAGTLSGGERQMLAMARALVAEPQLLLLDEPSAGLSPLLVEAIFDKIAEINAAGVPILMVEQNARRALAMSHRGYVLDLGRNRFEGTGPALLHDPKVIDLYLGGTGRIDAAPDSSAPEPA